MSTTGVVTEGFTSEQDKAAQEEPSRSPKWVKTVRHTFRKPTVSELGAFQSAGLPEPLPINTLDGRLVLQDQSSQLAGPAPILANYNERSNRSAEQTLSFDGCHFSVDGAVGSKKNKPISK